MKTKWLMVVISGIVLLLVVSLASCTSTTPDDATPPNDEPSTTPDDEYVTIKFIDSSEMKLYDWSFLYIWADQNNPPPEGYVWNLDTERTSEFLFLRHMIDGTKIRLHSDEITKFEWAWEEDESTGWLITESFTISKSNGEAIVITDFENGIGWYCGDTSELTQKEYAQTLCANFYITGNEGEFVSEVIKFPLFYARSILYEQQNFSVPLEIIFVSE